MAGVYAAVPSHQLHAGPAFHLIILKKVSYSKLAHCNGNSIYVLLFWVFRGLSPHFHIHVSVSDLYIPKIGTQHIFPEQQNMQIDRGNI